MSINIYLIFTYS
jgi:hypothetical protein